MATIHGTTYLKNHTIMGSLQPPTRGPAGRLPTLRIPQSLHNQPPSASPTSRHFAYSTAKGKVGGSYGTG